jgi:hypothetical protein
MQRHTKLISQSTIVGTIEDTTNKLIKTYATNIINAFQVYMKSSQSVGQNSWEYAFECDYVYITALNTEIQKHFDHSVFVRIYGGGAGASSKQLICRVNWGAD